MNSCECKVCTGPDPTDGRGQLIKRIHSTSNYWSAADQGRLAAYEGLPRSRNPFASIPHVNAHHWNCGYDSVAH